LNGFDVERNLNFAGLARLGDDGVGLGGRFEAIGGDAVLNDGAHGSLGRLPARGHLLPVLEHAEEADVAARGGVGDVEREEGVEDLRAERHLPHGGAEHVVEADQALLRRADARAFGLVNADDGVLSEEVGRELAVDVGVLRPGVAVDAVLEDRERDVRVGNGDGCFAVGIACACGRSIGDLVSRRGVGKHDAEAFEALGEAVGGVNRDRHVLERFARIEGKRLGLRGEVGALVGAAEVEGGVGDGEGFVGNIAGAFDADGDAAVGFGDALGLIRQTEEDVAEDIVGARGEHSAVRGDH
jgi:hypothetical protein